MHSRRPSRDRSTLDPTNNVPIKSVRAGAYTIPTSSPESDGTLEWDSTTLITVNITAGGKEGFGYTYASAASAKLIDNILQKSIIGSNAFDTPICYERMCATVRNLGRSGVAACAIAAVDNALWDLKAKLFDQPIIALLGAARNSVAVYGSGGFTSYGPKEIRRQIEGWRKQGIEKFKIKIGRNAQQDRQRIEAAIKTLPGGGKLFVDANGAYHARQAVEMAEIMGANGITWFEEPVPSADEEGLRFVREHAPACMDIAAGEYGFELADFHSLLAHETIDVLQVDATRCLGVTGFLKAAALSEAYRRPLSSHCAPALHAPLVCHVKQGIHIEYFWDHARIENLLFEGIPKVLGGFITPQAENPGFGVIFKVRDAEQYAL